jgi:phosphoribosylanthranilate isomerase
MTKIKICGLKRLEDIEYVNSAGPDFVGFVFAPSARQVTASQAAQLRNKLQPSILSVGVFVNAPLEEVARIAKQVQLDYLQLHGDETVEYSQRLQELCGLPIIRAVRVQSRSSFSNIANYPCDYLLLDTYTKGQYGGSGQRFDLALLSQLQLPKPYFVAGGLDADNVAEVLKQGTPYGVDVSGGVETAGVKDYNKIKRFIAKVKEQKND